MKKLALLLILFISFNTNAKELNEDEIKKIKLDVHSILEAFNKADEKVMSEKSHKSIIKIMGGKESFAKKLKQSMKYLTETGLKYEDIKLGKPTTTYNAGKEELCFISCQSIITNNNRKFKSLSFMVAIREIGKNRWTYIDGAGFQKNKKLLWTLLPDLEANVKFPQFKNEEIN
ncbi:MAG: hypothetical protein NE334_09125 [Lentisphaeraceae bacterium]|nr:hypothetical protein [Lentisphaeraceae bacterium]